MIELWVRGIGLLGPGLNDWASGAAALRALGASGSLPVAGAAEEGAGPVLGVAATPDAASWVRTATVVPTPARLPPNERRRAGTVIKAAVAVADQAVAMADADPTLLATIFTSSTSDPANCHALCEALATPERLVSPTRFTNSVHNTPAGYWHIATQSRRASTSLAAFDDSFGAGLLEAAVACQVSGEEMLLVACDVPYPAPMHALRPLLDTFAVALLLAPRTATSRRSAAALRIELCAEAAAATHCRHEGLEALRAGIPAARALPLLWALARAGDSGRAAQALHLEAAEGCSLAITVEACT